MDTRNRSNNNHNPAGRTIAVRGLQVMSRATTGRGATGLVGQTPSSTGNPRVAGAVSMQVLIILVPVLFGLMGFAVDLGRLYLIRGELNQAANAMAIAAAQQLNGTEAALENAALAANIPIDQTLGDGNAYNFGSLPLNGTGNGYLNNSISAPTFFASMSDATDPTSSNFADGTTARYAQINIQADAPLTFWSLLSLGTAQKTTVGATATAGISAPLCTVCAMEDFAVADLSSGSDAVDFGFTYNTKYTFYFDCTGSTSTVAAISDATVTVPYVMIDQYNPNITLDETQQLFRIGASGLMPIAGASNRTFACFTVSGGTAPYYLWGNAGNGGTSTVPAACTTATANAQVEDMLCGLDGRFEDPTTQSVCTTNVTDITDISTAYSTDTDLTDYDDYTLYGGNGRRLITVPIVSTLSTTAGGTMDVVGFRQFLVTATPNTTGNYIVPTDSHGRFNAIYVGNVAPVKQGFYNSLPIAATQACSITSGPGKVVLNQ